MYINPIYAGPVALAHALALATRAHTQLGVSRRSDSTDDTSRRRFAPLRRLAQWWQQLGAAEGPTADPVQLLLLSEPAGRPYATALSGLLLMDHIRKSRAAARQERAELR
jgi:hypothetical protein